MDDAGHSPPGKVLKHEAWVQQQKEINQRVARWQQHVGEGKPLMCQQVHLSSIAQMSNLCI